MKRIIILYILSLVLIISCTTFKTPIIKNNNPIFFDYKLKDHNKALIYFFRPHKYVGSAAYFDIYFQKQRLFSLYDAGYFPLEIDEGEYTFIASEMKYLPEVQDTINQNNSLIGATIDYYENSKYKDYLSICKIKIKRGDIYYIKGIADTKLNKVVPLIEIVSKEIGKSEIIECRLIKKDDIIQEK